jgi:octaprenyl-diphosphate synthase
LFAASCQTGAMLAEGDETVVESLYRFGLGIGMAFQVIDDTLDFVGKESKVGKPVMSDLKEGKLTLPVIHCFASSSKDEKKKLTDIVLGKDKSDSDLEFLNSLIKKYKSIEFSIQKARYFVEEAKTSLDELDDNDAKAEFLQFADFLIDRDF